MEAMLLSLQINELAYQQNKERKKESKKNWRKCNNCVMYEPQRDPGEHVKKDKTGRWWFVFALILCTCGTSRSTLQSWHCWPNVDHLFALTVCTHLTNASTGTSHPGICASVMKGPCCVMMGISILCGLSFWHATDRVWRESSRWNESDTKWATGGVDRVVDRGIILTLMLQYY